MSTAIRCVCALPILLSAALQASAQVSLTGAVEFSVTATGATNSSQIWNTLGGDSYFDLWLALNPDGSSALNGPSDSQAGINIPLTPGNSYTFYTFGQEGCCYTGIEALNLFFNGDTSTPGISVFGQVNSSAFGADGASTLTLAGTPVAGSGTKSYQSPGAVVLVSSYDWHTPASPPLTICQSFSFTSGTEPDYFGSFTLEVFPSATLTLGQSSGTPGSSLKLSGSGFDPSETVNIYFNGLKSLMQSETANSSGSFAATVIEPQVPFGLLSVYALGSTSGNLGVASLSVTPGLFFNPASGSPGASISAEGAGFGSGEAVKIYWNSPRQLLGTATANSVGSFIGSGGVAITIPANASPGTNAVIGIGETTLAVGVGRVLVN